MMMLNTATNRKDEIARWKNCGRRTQIFNCCNQSKFYNLDSQYCKKSSTRNLVDKHFKTVTHRGNRAFCISIQEL